MKILVVNCGSSSLKFQLIDSETEEVAASGLCERIGLDGALIYKVNGDKIKQEIDLPDHEVAIKKVLDTLLDKEIGVLTSLDEIGAIGHRMVHGGEKFSSSVIINEEIIKQIETCNDLAPLHNPANLLGVRACQEVMPGVPNVVVFDTAFHQTMPSKAYLYALPKEYYEKYGVRRYGFHGTSHSFVSKRLAELAGLDINNSRMIICHIGSGASISAIKDGKSVDTSMGMTPLEGLMMGTRSGDMDPAIIEFICQKENITVQEMTTILNKKSGALGLSGLSNDYRDLVEAAQGGNQDAINALDVMVYRVIKYIGAYYMALGGVDAIALTAGAGENNKEVREMIMEGISALGVKIDCAPARSAQILKDINLCFLFAQKYHPAMRFVGAVRKEMGIRTLFNVLGPLANPAGATMQLFGVYSEELVEPLAHVLRNLGVKRAMVVYGRDSMDEISLSAETKVCEFKNDEFKSYVIKPEDLGLTRCNKEDLVGGTPQENAAIVNDILGGAKGPKTDVVLLNAGAAIYLASDGITLKDGIEKAREIIVSGKAKKQLKEFIEETNK